MITNGHNARPLDLRDRGLIEALRVGGDSHNVLDSFPTLPGAQGELYSPLWDVHIAVWSEAAVAQGLNTAQTDAHQIRQLLNCPAIGFLTSPPMADQAPEPPPAA